MGKFRRNWYSLYSTSLVALPLLAVIIGCPGARQSARAYGGVVQVSSAESSPSAASVSASPAVIVVPSALAGTSGAAGPAGAVGAAAAPTSGTSPSAMTLTFGDLRGLVEAAARVEEVWGDIKFIVPVTPVVISALLIIGGYFIRTESKNLRRDIEGRFDSRIKNQKEEFDKRFKDINERLTMAFEGLDAKMNFQGAGVRYAVALYAWRNGRLRDAIYNATEALDRADYSIRLFKSLNSRGTGEAKDLTRDRRYGCFIVGDLAYYYADAYKASNQIDDATHALRYARRLVNEWDVFVEGPPLNLVDNYLYVLATVKEVPEEELAKGSTLWRDSKQRLTEYLRKEEPDNAEQHIALFDKFFGAS
jgi:hypothetical protein